MFSLWPYVVFIIYKMTTTEIYMGNLKYMMLTFCHVLQKYIGKHQCAVLAPRVYVMKVSV